MLSDIYEIGMSHLFAHNDSALNSREDTVCERQPLGDMERKCQHNIPMFTLETKAIKDFDNRLFAFV